MINNNKYVGLGILIVGILLSLMNVSVGYFLLGFGASVTARMLFGENGIQKE
jgi:hypothetical protein